LAFRDLISAPGDRYLATRIQTPTPTHTALHLQKADTHHGQRAHLRIHPCRTSGHSSQAEFHACTTTDAAPSAGLGRTKFALVTCISRVSPASVAGGGSGTNQNSFVLSTGPGETTCQCTPPLLLAHVLSCTCAAYESLLLGSPGSVRSMRPNVESKSW
jgi:hypothetical protein